MEYYGEERIQFSAIRNSGPDHIASNEIITFTQINLNTGDAFNMETGVFTAPFHGVYEFQFSGLSNNFDKWIQIDVLMNDSKQFEITNYNGHGVTGKPWENVNFSWSFKMTKNDRVFLKSVRSNGLHIYPGKHHTYFSGKLAMKF